MKRRIAAMAILLGLMLPIAGAQAALEPLTPGWQDIFRMQWEPSTWRGRPRVAGFLTNTSPYTLSRIKLLVESLDGSGELVGQRVDGVQGALAPFTGTYFSVAAPPPSTRYRVRVFSFDRIELPGSNFD